MRIPPPHAADDLSLQAVLTDARRLAAVRATGLLDSPPEEGFDRLTALATRVIGAPVSFISLVDQDRDFYKSHCGFGEPLASERVLTGRTFCHYSLVSDGPLVLDDTTALPGFAEVPTVKSLGVRAYAGIPLVTAAGQCIGSFCAIDFTPRRWSELDIHVLTELAQSAMREIALREALRRAEAANQAKSVFLANMSHEIRTPMNAIIGLTHLLTRDTPDARQRAQLGKIGGAAQHLLQIINDILDLSKVEAGKMVLERADFSLGSLLSRCLEMVGESAQAKGLDLVVDTDRLPPRLCGDATRLSQALINLLGNAVKFTARGSVRLQAELLRTDGRRLLTRFTVRDTGEGIAPEHQAQLFNAFEQGDSGTTRRHGGTGLGVALTRHLAQLMGGEVGLTSSPGVGSSFWFTAWLEQAADLPEAGPGGSQPIAALAAAATRTPLTPADHWPPVSSTEDTLRTELAGHRVLVVEDNLVNQEVAVALLGAVGLVVETADDGLAALELTRTRRYDLVLMDMQMPRLDGLATTRALRQRDGTALPIVAMTANAFGEDRAQCLAAGMNDHVAKPVDPARLYGTLRRWLLKPPPGAADSGLGASADASATLRRATEPAPAAAQSPADAVAALAAVPGLDLAQGLRQVNGRVETLLRALRQFVRVYGAGAPGLLAQDTGWRMAAHSLRGACGTVGAMALHGQLLHLEHLTDGAAHAAERQALARQIDADLRTLAAELRIAGLG